MRSSSIVLLSAAALTPSISAYRGPKGVALYQRQVTKSAALSQTMVSTTYPASTTSEPPNEFSEPFSINLDGQIFPPSVQLADLNFTPPSDFAIDCINCGITGNISLSAGGNFETVDVKPPSDVLEIHSYFDFTDHWVAATFDAFDARLNVSFELNVSSPHNEINVPLPFTKTVSKTIDIFTLSATLSTSIHGWVNTTIDIDFTYGFDLSIPPGSEIIVDLSHPENTTILGFNQATLTPIPFNSIRSDLDIDFELSLRPSVAFLVLADVTVASGAVQLTVDLDVPKLDVDIKQVHNVTSKCDPAPASTPSDQVFGNATLLVPSIGFDAIESLNEKVGVFGDQASKTQSLEQGKSINITTACYFFDAAKKTMGPAAEAKVSPSLAAGSRVPVAAMALSMMVPLLLFMSM